MRLIASWQTRSLAMVTAAAGNNPSEELMRFASNLTIDSEEYKEFGNQNSGSAKVIESKVPVHASTQDAAAKANFDKAADKNSFDMLALFGQGMEKGPPGQ